MGGATLRPWTIYTLVLGSPLRQIQKLGGAISDITSDIRERSLLIGTGEGGGGMMSDGEVALCRLLWTWIWRLSPKWSLKLHHQASVGKGIGRRPQDKCVESLSDPGGGGTGRNFLSGCANAVSETVPFLLHFLGKRHPFSCILMRKNTPSLLRFWWKRYPRCWHTRDTLYIGSTPSGQEGGGVGLNQGQAAFVGEGWTPKNAVKRWQILVLLSHSDSFCLIILSKW